MRKPTQLSFVSRARNSLFSCSCQAIVTRAEASHHNSPTKNMVVSQEVFGKTETGEDVIKYTIQNNKGLELVVISWGATLVSLKCPDR